MKSRLAGCLVLILGVTSPRAAGPGRLDRAWNDLASDDPARGYVAVHALSKCPGAVDFLRSRLKPIPTPPRDDVRRLVADLDSPRFQVRDRAIAALEALGEAARTALREAIADRPTLELRRRVEALLERLDEPAPLTPDQTREVRAVQALEMIGGVEARKLLESLAAGAAHARLTREAQSALERLPADQGRPPCPVIP